MHNHKNLNNKHVQYCNQYSKYEGGGKSTYRYEYSKGGKKATKV